MKPELTIITLTYDFMKYIVPVSGRFPRNQRYLLGERIENTTFAILENLLEAKFSRNKREVLVKTNLTLEKLRFFIRLSYDLKLIDIKRFEYISKMLNEIGVQLGGWLKSQAL